MSSIIIEDFKKNLQLKKCTEIRIVSDSMSPLLVPGEKVKVVPISGELKRFDIVVFDYYGKPFCHFYWGRIANEDSLCTRSLKFPHRLDLPIHEHAIIGKIVCKKITLYQKIKVYFRIIWNKKK